MTYSVCVRSRFIAVEEASQPEIRQFALAPRESGGDEEEEGMRRRRKIGHNL